MKTTHRKPGQKTVGRKPARKAASAKGNPGGARTTSRGETRKAGPQKPGRHASPPPAGRDAPLRSLSPLLPVEPRPEDAKARAAALRAVDAALDKKALEPVLLDVRALASYTDYILVVSGRSDRQVSAIADGVVEVMTREGRRPLGKEGLKDGQWSLIDLGDLIVHVFYHPVREFYDLEGLWADAPRIKIDIPPEARASLEDSYAL